MHACLLYRCAHSNTNAFLVTSMHKSPQPYTNPKGMYCHQAVKSLFPSFPFQYCLLLPEGLTFQGHEQQGFTHL